MSIMPPTRVRRLLQPLLFSWLLLSCQSSLYPTAQLPAETDIQLNQAISADANLETFIAPYRQQVSQKMNEVIGRATVELNGRSGKIETNLGNFVADLQQQQAASAMGKPVDMGGITSGGLRAIIPQGDIKVGDIFEVMPFENELLVLTLSGETTRQLFQYAAERKNLSLSNATFTIRQNKAENILIGGKPFDGQRSYTIAISDYLANGGDDMTFLKQALRSDKAGILLRDAIIKQIRQFTAQHKPIEAAIEGRVKQL
jgi:2',3'-cyclic-nucleotide 2'-phosphodiesterase (5'-nucleotidase family)